jgi:hypothetical protein
MTGSTDDNTHGGWAFTAWIATCVIVAGVFSKDLALVPRLLWIFIGGAVMLIALGRLERKPKVRLPRLRSHPSPWPPPDPQTARNRAAGSSSEAG